jgi:peptidoglycan/LPS O-acetylase OafA/YrhL
MHVRGVGMRNPSLDGLRGVAILLVVLNHHGYLNLGWMGVDLFFVLSGYLITSILRRQRREPLYWTTFWLKRATRILPPLVMLLIATVLLSPQLSLWQMPAYLLSLGDVMAYIRPSADILQPLWSLAVEEHFYIVWPIALRLLPVRNLVTGLVSLIILEPLVRAAMSMVIHQWQLVYYLTPFRLDGLALGSLLAIAYESQRATQFITKWSALATLLGMFTLGAFRLVLGHRFTRDDPTPVYNAVCYALVAYIATFFVAFLVGSPQSIISRCLSWKPIVFIGTISYGLYLYQELCRDLIMKMSGFTPQRAFWIELPLLVTLSWLSFSFYELPIMMWGRRTAESYRIRDLARNPAAITLG